jgi:hypothetical protein
MASFVERMLGAAKLDVQTFEEVEADRTATPQAMAVVLISSIAAGIGGIRMGITGLIGMLLASLISWMLWAALVWLIGTKLLPEPETRSDVGELLRTTGFSSSPGVFRILGVLPVIGGVLQFLIGIWMLAAMVIAVRQALDYKSTARAIGVCLIGWVIAMVVFWLLMPSGMIGGTAI